jgi:hypothetical protein
MPNHVMKTGRTTTTTDFGKALLDAIGNSHGILQRTDVERAELWERNSRLGPEERRRHAMPDGHQLATLDQVLSLAHAEPDFSKAERSMFFLFVNAVETVLKGRRALVRKDRREGWVRLVRSSTAQKPPAQVKQRRLLGVRLPHVESDIRALVESWIRSGDAFLVDQLVDASPRMASHDPVEAAWARLSKVCVHPHAHGLHLDDADLALAMQWVNPTHASAAGKLISSNNGERAVQLGSLTLEQEDGLFREMHRCLGARYAERFCARLLELWGHVVVDVSGLAVRNPTDPRWITHDLEVDDMPVDVKSVTYNRAGLYTWPLVKKLRPAVRYDAVQMRWGPSLVSFLDGTILPHTEYLGSLSRSDLIAFAAMADPPLSLEISESVFEGKPRLAAWCFAVGDAGYQAWNVAYGDVLDALRRTDRHRPAMSLGRSAILRAHGNANILRSNESRLLEEHVALCRIADAIRVFGKSPRVLIAALLNEFQRALHGKVTLSRQLKNALGTLGRNYPLGVFDPTGSILAFLSALLQLLENPTAITDITSIRLMSPQWLRGTTRSGEQVTLITNCKHCSEFPLIRGRERTCEHGTRRLVCARGHCCGRFQ